MATQINININGFGTHLNGAPRSGSLRDRRVSGYSERVIDTEPVTRWQDEFYTLKPGFSPVGYLHAERKLKKKKKKNCSNGQVCGFSCISKSKTCTANMTTAQFMEHNKAKRLAAAEKRKAAKAAQGGSAIINSSEANAIIQQAKRIEVGGLKRGDVVKFARWGIDQPDGTVPVIVSTIKVVSVDGQDVRVKIEGKKNIFTVTDATDGYFYANNSKPELAHYLRNAQKEASNLPKLQQKLESVDQDIKKFVKKDYPYGSADFKKQRAELESLFDEARSISFNIDKAEGYINKASTMIKAELSLPTRSVTEYQSQVNLPVVDDIDYLLNKLKKLAADILSQDVDAILGVVFTPIADEDDTETDSV